MTMGIDLKNLPHLHIGLSGAAPCSQVTGGLDALSAVHDQLDPHECSKDSISVLSDCTAAWMPYMTAQHQSEEAVMTAELTRVGTTVATSSLRVSTHVSASGGRPAT